MEKETESKARDTKASQVGIEVIDRALSDLMRLAHGTRIGFYYSDNTGSLVRVVGKKDMDFHSDIRLDYEHGQLIAGHGLSVNQCFQPNGTPQDVTALDLHVTHLSSEKMDLTEDRTTLSPQTAQIERSHGHRVVILSNGRPTVLVDDSEVFAEIEYDESGRIVREKRKDCLREVLYSDSDEVSTVTYKNGDGKVICRRIYEYCDGRCNVYEEDDHGMRLDTVEFIDQELPTNLVIEDRATYLWWQNNQLVWRIRASFDPQKPVSVFRLNMPMTPNNLPQVFADNAQNKDIDLYCRDFDKKFSRSMIFCNGEVFIDQVTRFDEQDRILGVANLFDGGMDDVGDIEFTTRNGALIALPQTRSTMAERRERVALIR